MLEAKSIRVRLGRGEASQLVLDGIDLVVRPGAWVTVLGRSGAGKSTLLRVLSLQAREFEGAVSWQGEDCSTWTSSERRRFVRQNFGCLEQTPLLFPDLDVRENTALPLLLDGQDARRAHERAEAVLDELSVVSRATLMPNQLSGGELHRVALARALVAGPEVLFADEPTGDLDPETGQVVFEVLERRRQAGLAVLLVTHDQALLRDDHSVLRLADGALTPVSGPRDRAVPRES
ncbi:MAG: ATP-binding cassette domain-containing protein [Planctomycetota bacterium]